MIRRVFATCAVAVSSLAFAGPLDQGNIAVIQDTTGVITQSGTEGSGFTEPLQSRFCKETAKAFYASHPDEFDGLITFSAKTFSDLENVQQGTPVRLTAQGLGHQSSWNFTSQYGSAGKLSQCVFMASLDKLPNSPDGQTSGPFGLPFGLTGIELVGHEYGHHWLMAANFDKGNGAGASDLLRGYESESPNLHYSAYANSGSVMYGEFITDNGNGSFTLRGGDRKYNQLDQYMMGLRAANEVAPMFAVDDGSGHGSPAVAQPKNSSLTVNGTRVDITIADIIRANGQRNPSVATSQKCWRVAFVLVTPGNTVPTAAQIAKVEAYRARWENWFKWATDGRGSMDTRLNGSGCSVNGASSGPFDGGVGTLPDAGTTPKPDAGTSAQDAGTTTDAGSEQPATGGENGAGGTPEETGEAPPPAYNKDNIGKVKDDCGCTAGTGSLAMFALLGFALRRQRSSSRFKS